MSGYQLEATDGTGSHTIPVGETVIGRGPMLDIADKRVSRSHAVLEVVGDKLRLKSIHVNPCFYQANGKSAFVPLQRNEWCRLHSGDCISLLPDKYSFRVITKNPSEEATLRNSQGLEEETGLNDNNSCPTVAAEAKVSPLQNEPSLLSAANTTRTNGKLCSDVPSDLNSKDDVEPAKPAQRKRVLPHWMLQGDLQVKPLPSHVTATVKKKRTVTQRTQPTASHKSKDEDRPGKKHPEVSFPTTSNSLGKAATPVIPAKSHVAAIEEEENMEEDPPKVSTPPPSNCSASGSPSASDNQPSVSKVVSHDDISLSPVSSQHTQETQKKRTPCMYGDQCYRKNPTHFQEFSHPGDGDYNDVGNGSQDDNDERPECPYGTDCYRKNPQHKLEYKHTRPPGRKLRKRNPKKGKKSALDGDSDNDGEANEYDLEDSFIDDDDEDFDITDEDSDWMPDSQDKDSEDVKELLKEAKQFVKGRR